MKKIIWLFPLAVIASIVLVKFMISVDNEQTYLASISSQPRSASDLRKLMTDFKENVSKEAFDEIYGGQWVDSEGKPHIGLTSFDYNPYISEIAKNHFEIFELVDYSLKDLLHFWDTVFTPEFIADYNIKGVALDEQRNALDVGLGSSSALLKFQTVIHADKDKFYINISTYIMGDVKEEYIYITIDHRCCRLEIV